MLVCLHAGKILLMLQGGLYLSDCCGWFWFNQRRGNAVLIAVAATLVVLLLLSVWALVGRFFGSKAQFSLATLLLMVPVIAIPSGWLARELDVAQRQQNALARLYGRGPRVEATCKVQSVNSLVPSFLSSSRSPFLASTLGALCADDIIHVVIVQAGDGDVATAGQLSHLERLVLAQGKITDAGLKPLEGLLQLTFLNLSRTQITDAGLEHLQDLTHMNWLSFDGTSVNGSGFRHLKNLTALQYLDLDGTQITDAGIRSLAGLPKLRELDIADTKVTDSGLECFKKFPQLRALKLDGTRITDAGLKHLMGLPRLESLNLGETDVTSEGIAELQLALPACRIEWARRYD